MFGLVPLALASGTAYLVDFAQFLLWLSTFYFSALQNVVLHSLESLFIRVHLYLYFLFGLVPLAGRILRGFVKTTSKRYSLHIKILIDFAQFLLQFALNFTFWHSILV